MPILLVFAAGETAAHRVLAVPAVVRALREVHLAGLAHCGVYVPGGWLPSPAVAGEIERLAPGLAVTYCKLMPMQPMLIVCGEKLLSHQELCAMLPSEHRMSPSLCETQGQQSGKCALPLATAKAVLATRSRELLSATGKLGDGIVSRHLNRPISQAITRVVLRGLGPIQPIKATAVTAMISVAMIAVLVLLPSQSGLLVGALLFQAASIFDGVDGEIARATFRTSATGASVDSLVDAATNFLFFAGVVSNLYVRGDHRTAGIALAGMCGLMLGTFLLGLSAERRRGVVDFESVKQQVSRQNSRLMQWLTWLTMRDFYAFAAALLIALGLVVPAVMAFATVVTGWLVVVLALLVVRR